ncbi:MAG: hypothetical protein SAL07_00405, partial [Oscillatoria sp. PMC 1051.18]|nr:hypothetical protein [Oscillatoria sp. PMC 1050.18]MEC5028347.1 hypothetical protein [Oscillatoria sp. PMC 1051.18]
SFTQETEASVSEDEDWGDILDLQDEEVAEASAADDIESLAESEEWGDILDLQEEEEETQVTVEEEITEEEA